LLNFLSTSHSHAQASFDLREDTKDINSDEVSQTYV